jgi:dienelactone hydrolase
METAIRQSWRAGLLAGTFIAVLPGTFHGAIAAEPAPLEAFGRLPTLEHLVISPDGTQLAYVRTEEDRRTLIVRRFDNAEVLGGARLSETKLRNIAWANNDNLLASVSDTSLPPYGFTGGSREWSKLYAYTVSKKKLQPIAFAVKDERTFNVVTGGATVREVAGEAVLYAPGYYLADSALTHRALPGLFAFSIPELRTRLIAKGTEPGTQWLIDDVGQIAAQLVYRDEAKTWEIKARKDGKLIVLASGTAPIDVPTVLGFSADGSFIIVRFIENGDPVWKPLSISDGSWGPPLERGASFAGTIHDRRNGRIIGGVRELGDNQYVFFDNELQAHWNAILRAFPDERVQIESHTDDYAKVVVKVFGAKDGFVYAVFDWYSHRAAILGHVYEGVAAPAEVKAISYSAADGLTIPGFLTLPQGTAKDLPLVVMPHGGPAAADTLEFDWWAQALAAQGYAVLQPNFRGSNLNYRFVATGFGQWGRKMQTDLSDGVRYLAQQGMIDPKRVCIVGASYGGYAALAGVTLDPGVYRCAVSVGGISDPRRYRSWLAEDHLGLAQRYWDRFMGTSDQRDPSLLSISPIEHVAQADAAVLLIHGRDDTVVPFEQSEMMLTALQRAGKPVELVALKHEDHWLSRSATRLQMLQACVAFLKKYNPPD